MALARYGPRPQRCTSSCWVGQLHGKGVPGSIGMPSWWPSGCPRTEMTCPLAKVAQSRTMTIYGSTSSCATVAGRRLSGRTRGFPRRQRKGARPTRTADGAVCASLAITAGTCASTDRTTSLMQQTPGARTHQCPPAPRFHLSQACINHAFGEGIEPYLKVHGGCKAANQQWIIRRGVVSA